MLGLTLLGGSNPPLSARSTECDVLEDQEIDAFKKAMIAIKYISNVKQVHLANIKFDDKAFSLSL